MISGMYLSPAMWFSMGRYDRSWTLILMSVVNLSVASSFMIAMHASKKFPDTRGKGKILT